MPPDNLPPRLTTEGEISPLTGYVLRGLERYWLPGSGLFATCHRLDEPRGSVADSSRDAFCTLNVLLGLSRLQDATDSATLATIYRTAALDLASRRVPVFAYGMALWAGSELSQPLPEVTARIVDRLLDHPAVWLDFTAQDAASLTLGCIAMARNAPDPWDRRARSLYRFIAGRFDAGESGLFLNNARSPHRRFASFATAIYLALACFQYGEWAGDDAAIARGLAATAALIGRQGPQGEWPWFYDAVSGRVLDFYEIYSVHQDGMAPALLRLAEKHGLPGAREALVRGFRWILGENQLGQSMLVPDSGLILRSQYRRGEAQGRARRALRSGGNLLLGRNGGLVPADRVAIRRECRSYHLGWILWAFADRQDIRELTHHPDFLAGARSA